MVYGADDRKISAVTFRVVNMAESVRFYRDVLGMEFLYGGEGTGFSSLRARDPQSAILNLEQHKPVTRCEIVTNVSQFRNASAFVSWLGLCPENKISGGKVLHTKSRRVRSRFATGLRMVEPLHRAKDYLGEFFRLNRRLGKPQAITTTSHKLARIVYHCSVASEQYFTIFVSSS